MARASSLTTSILLTAIRTAVKKQKTNPYQLAKASGIPLTTVQRLLTIKLNVPLRNVEMLAKALGLMIRLVPNGKSIVLPGTGRKHGKKKAA
jgi:hypothetical protein